MPLPENTDIWPLTLRGPLSTNSSRVVTFARMLVHNGRIYVAESGDKGRTIRAVTSYEMPDAEFISRGGRTGKIGPWSWSSCGCSSRWQQHTREEIIALDSSPVLPSPGQSIHAAVSGDGE